MKLLSPLAVLLSASMAVAIGVTPPRAAATATPQWSGLDTRSYDGAIPGPGGLIATVPLDPDRLLTVSRRGAMPDLIDIRNGVRCVRALDPAP